MRGILKNWKKCKTDSRKKLENSEKNGRIEQPYQEILKKADRVDIWSRKGQRRLTARKFSKLLVKTRYVFKPFM